MDDRSENDHTLLEDSEENSFPGSDKEEDDANVDIDSEEIALAARKESRESNVGKKKDRKRLSLMKSPAFASKRGVCYLSRIPRHMDHVKLRHILSHYGDIERIYLVPENPSAQMHRKRAGGYRGTEFSEGWVEFGKKRIAKKVARLLNGEQMGGKRRSAFYYDIWNIKYLRKFTWDDLTEEIAYKHAVREQKMALEISAAKRERDFYLSKVEKSNALNHIQERANKKHKNEASESKGSDSDNSMVETKIIRHFPQNRPIIENPSRNKKPGLSEDFLAGVFGRNS